MKVGDVKDVVAWVNAMPGPGSAPTLHVTGKVTAPTPCYEVLAEFDGFDKSDPPVYRVKVTLSERPGLCPQVLTDKEFHYVERNYAGTSKQVRVLSDTDSKTVDIQIVS
ncbi:hypothetical protein [Stappia sp.]|jgi:hypothetical protein|uniref:hypothetical protein n=1 Tax=Stappia sp. TaxID=1870903 RepID=UPI003D09E38A